MSNMYMQEEKTFIAADVFPIISVPNISDRYYTYSRADFNRNQMRMRALSSTVAQVGYRIDNQPSYLCNVWELGRAIDDQLRGNADTPLNLDLEATRLLTMQALINREYQWFSTFFTTGVWTNNWTGGTANSAGGYPTAPPTSNASAYTFLKWSDPGSTPIQDMRTFKRIIQLTCTFRPNKAVIGRPVLDALIDHPDFVARILYGQKSGVEAAQVVLEAIAQIFELDRVHVSDAVYNTASELAGPDSGATYVPATYNAGINAGESNTFFATNGMWVGFTPKAPGIMTPGCGYTFAWTGYFGATRAGTRLSSYYFQPTRSTNVEMESAYAEKLVSADMGGFLSSCI
jgi:hypothetical protein